MSRTSSPISQPFPIATSPSARLTLRNATADSHARLDRLADAFDLGDARRYGDFIAANAAALLPLERLLEDAKVETLLPDWPRRRRSDAIRQDLAALRIEAEPMRIDATFTDAAALFGMLYTLEGSRLGARHLVRRIAAAHRDDLPRHYLTHGDTAELWRSFVDALESSSAVKNEPEAAIDGALFAFTIFERALRAPAGRG